MQRNVTNEYYGLVTMSIGLHRNDMRACYRRHLGPHDQEGTDAYRTNIMSLFKIFVKSTMNYVTCIILISCLLNVVRPFGSQRSGNHIITRRLPHL
jgi:hypothetical protein